MWQLLTRFAVALAVSAGIPATASAQNDPLRVVEAATRRIEVNGMSFPVLDIGSGKPVLLLHGFPDSRLLWRNQVAPLVNAGFRVIAPDLRGFGDAPKPAAVDDYKIPTIAADVLAILDALKVEKTVIVGHDWGAIVAWYMASHHPDRTERLAVLSVGARGTSGTTTLRQREKGWYTLFFQFSEVAETALAANDWRLFRDWIGDAADLDSYLRDLAHPGALTAGLNWYRANSRPGVTTFTLKPIIVPVMGVWSDGDRFLTEDHMKNSGEIVKSSWRYERLVGATHWMMLDQPAEVNRLLLSFFNEK